MLAAVADAGEKWAAAIPATFTPAQGVAAAAAAYNDARAVIRSIASSFHGTIPLPPWPAPPELQAAMKRIRTIHDGLQVFAERTPTQTWPRDSGKVGPALVREGRAVYAEADKLTREAAARPRLDDMLKLVPDPRNLGWVLLALAALWLLSDAGEPKSTAQDALG